MKKIFYLTLVIIISGQISAQIKIGGNATINPEHALDVVGSITVRDKIYAGGDDATLGNPGLPGQVLVSQGDGLPPRWRTLNVPTIEENFYYLIYNNSFTDYGQASPGNFNTVGATGNGPYTEGTARNNAMFTNFLTISGLTQTFDVFSTDNQVYITFEAVAHLDSNAADTGVDFVCGIFVGGSTQATRTLRGIRKMTLQQSYGAGGNPFLTYTQITLASGLGITTPGNPHYVEVACKRTATYGTVNNLGIGRAVTTNINDFVAKTSLKVEVYEIPTQFNDIID